jgi:hypothetical protein
LWLPPSLQLPIKPCSAPSFNGRTDDSDSSNRGSNPWGATKTLKNRTSSHFPKHPRTLGCHYFAMTYANKCVRERPKACECSRTFLWGKMWGRISQSVGKANLPLWRSAVALTIKEIQNAKPKDQKYKLADGGGLCLLIQPWGGKFWLWRYRSMAPRRT